MTYNFSVVPNSEGPVAVQVTRHHLLHFDLVAIAVVHDAFARLAVSARHRRHLARLTQHGTHTSPAGTPRLLVVPLHRLGHGAVYDEPAQVHGLFLKGEETCSEAVLDLTSGLLIPMPKATVAQTILTLSSIHSR